MEGEWDGRPENPERDGWHWLGTRRFDRDLDIAPVFWLSSEQVWCNDDGRTYPAVPGSGVEYLGPCLTPDEHRAALSAARREGAEAMRERAATVCDNLAAFAADGRPGCDCSTPDDALWYGRRQYAEECASHIRALSLDAPQEGGGP